MGGLGDKVAKGVIWIMLERFGVQAVSFVVTLVLARLLTPADYGTIALLSIFTSIAGMLVSSGMGMALVQKKNATELDFNSLFYASLFMASLLYAILFFAAPYSADFYSVPELKAILRVISFSLFFSAINSVQGAELSRKMLFNLKFKISIITSSVSAVSGISFAFMGYGPWALVWQSVASGAAGVVAYWFIIAWRPKLMFSFSSLRSLFSYGWKIVSVSLIYSLYTNLYAMIIGKYYSKEALAFVNKGNSMPGLAMSTISGTICGVSFPALSKMQDEPLRVKDAVRRMIQCTSFFVFPLMAGLAVCSHDVVLLLLGEKWLPCVPYMRLACFAFALQPFHDINLQTIAALGRADVFLKLELIKDSIGVLFVLLFLRHSVYAFMLMITFVTGPVALVVNTWHNRRFIHYPCWKQLQDVVPTIATCLVMVVSVWLLGLLFPRGISLPILALKLIVQMLFGASVFCISAYFINSQSLLLYLDYIKPIISTKVLQLCKVVDFIRR